MQKEQDMEQFAYKNEMLTIHHSVTQIPDVSRFRLHAHDKYELYFLIEGRGYYTIEGTDYSFRPGMILIMRDGEVHTSHPSPLTTYDRISLNFSKDLFPTTKALLDEIFCNRPLGKDNLYLLRDESLGLVTKCMERICEDDGSIPYQTRFTTYLQTILLEMLRAKKAGILGEALLADHPAFSGSSAVIRRLLLYINQNLTSIQSLDVLEQEFFFSKSYLNRIFKESTGTSLWGYIILKRLLLARTLLQEGKQATLVASECGFGDYSSFYRQFKEHFGVSPIEARKK